MGRLKPLHHSDGLGTATSPLESKPHEHVSRSRRRDPGCLPDDCRVWEGLDRQLRPGGAFWRGQAERLLSAYVWSEGRAPDDGLTVHDISRDDIDVAAAWNLD